MALGFRDSRGSPRLKGVGCDCSSRPRNGKGSGDGWTELLVVNMAISGDMMGESCNELDAIEEALMAEAGMLLSRGLAWMVVWT